MRFFDPHNGQHLQCEKCEDILELRSRNKADALRERLEDWIILRWWGDIEGPQAGGTD